MESLWIIGFVVAWIFLQAWILPRLGVRTCLSPGCRVERAVAPGVPEGAEEVRERRADES